MRRFPIAGTRLGMKSLECKLRDSECRFMNGQPMIIKAYLARSKMSGTS